MPTTRALNASRPPDRLQVTSGSPRDQPRNQSIVQSHSVRTIGMLGEVLEGSRGVSWGYPRGPWDPQVGFMGSRGVSGRSLVHPLEVLGGSGGVRWRVCRRGRSWVCIEKRLKIPRVVLRPHGSGTPGHPGTPKRISRTS